MLRTVRIASFAVGVLVCATATAFAAGPGNCQYIKGPATAVSFGPDPATGLIHLTVPFKIGDATETTNIEVAILGFLNVAADGFPERALITHTWRIPARQLEIDWAGEGYLTRTNDPTIAHYTIRLDVKTTNHGGMTGTLFADGSFNLLNGTGTAGDFFGRVCRAPGRDAH